MFVLMISRSSLNWVNRVQKLGTQAKSKENLVDTLEVTFEVNIMNLTQNVCFDDF